MKKKQIILMGFVTCLVLGMMACGKPDTTEAVDSETTPAVTKEVVPTPEPEVTVAQDSAVTPEETATPVPTATVAPTETPEPTEAPVPTATPIPTETPAPTETPIPTATLSPIETPEPTETSVPTATPKPTVTPAPTPKPGAEVTIHFFAPLIVKDLSQIEAEDAIGFIEKMSEYAMSDIGTATETAMLDEIASDYFNAAEKSLLKDGSVLASAKACYGEDVTVYCIGWYSEYGRFYSTLNDKTFAELGVSKGQELNLYASYTVMVGGSGVAYTPCVLDVNLQLGFLNPTMKYMMAMPIWERVVLPELDGYTMEWLDNGVIMSPTKIRIYDGKINRYTLLVKMK